MALFLQEKKKSFQIWRQILKLARVALLQCGQWISRFHWCWWLTFSRFTCYYFCFTCLALPGCFELRPFRQYCQRQLNSEKSVHAVFCAKQSEVYSFLSSYIDSYSSLLLYLSGCRVEWECEQWRVQCGTKPPCWSLCPTEWSVARWHPDRR